MTSYTEYRDTTDYSMISEIIRADNDNDNDNDNGNESSSYNTPPSDVSLKQHCSTDAGEGLKVQREGVEEASSLLPTSTVIDETAPNPNPPPAMITHSHARIEQRLDRMESNCYNLFEALRQVSQQVYSVDEKLSRLFTTHSAPSVDSYGGKSNNNSSTCTNTSSNNVSDHCPENITSTDTSTATATTAAIDTTSSSGDGRVHLEAAHLNRSQAVNASTSVSSPSSSGFIMQESQRRKLTWNQRLEELKRFKAKNGNCNVPQIHSTGLGMWVSSQRSQNKRFTLGKTSSMTKTRQDLLNQLGFSWSLRKRFSWDERYAELKMMRDTKGTCNVPNSVISKPLFTWCQNQRKLYKNSLAGKGPSISGDRIEMLNALNFEWGESTEVSDSPVIPSSSGSVDSSEEI